MNHHTSKEELGVRFSLQNGRAELTHFYWISSLSPKQGQGWEKWLISNHMAEVVLRYHSSEEAREQFAAVIQWNCHIFFLCFGSAHHKYWFFLTSSSSEIIWLIFSQKIFSRSSDCSLCTFKTSSLLHSFHFVQRAFCSLTECAKAPH